MILWKISIDNDDDSSPTSQSLAILSELEHQTHHVQSALGYLDKALRLAQARSLNPTVLQIQRVNNSFSF